MGYGGSKALDAAEFLFPTDLQVTPTPVFRKVLLIGSCLTDLYFETFKNSQPETDFDYILFNSASDLPKAPPSPISEYDFQYLQVPVRTALTDRIVTGGRLNDPRFWEELLDDGYRMIDAMLEAGLTYNRTHGLLSLVSNFIVPQMDVASSIRGRQAPEDLTTIVRRLNEHLSQAIQRYDNVFLCNVEAVAASIGKRYLLDDMIGFFSHGSIFGPEADELDLKPRARIEAAPELCMLYESKRDEFLAAVYAQMRATYRTVHQIDQVKAVIFDLDDTLWRGQIAEDYRSDRTPWPSISGWPIGTWDAIQHLRARGILVAVCSKNDLHVVQRYWDNAIVPAFLKLGDFASLRINWKSKAENVLDICREFNIKARSVVFVDDNPVEREAVRSAMPEIRTIGSNPSVTRRILLWAAETQIPYLTSETTQRELSTRGQIVREQTRAVLSRDEFLSSLACSVTFHSISTSEHPDFSRILELTNKTNQFNTTGRRWTYADMLGFVSAGGRLVAFRVRDKFSDYGLAGAIFVSANSIQQFVMSCRVLGMDIEIAALAHVVKQIRADGMHHQTVFATLIDTPDNLSCRDVYTRAAFTALEQSAHQTLFGLNQNQDLVSPAHIESLTDEKIGKELVAQHDQQPQ